MSLFAKFFLFVEILSCFCLFVYVSTSEVSIFCLFLYLSMKPVCGFLYWFFFYVFLFLCLSMCLPLQRIFLSVSLFVNETCTWVSLLVCLLCVSVSLFVHVSLHFIFFSVYLIFLFVYESFCVYFSVSLFVYVPFMLPFSLFVHVSTYLLCVYFKLCASQPIQLLYFWFVSSQQKATKRGKKRKERKETFVVKCKKMPFSF